MRESLWDHISLSQASKTKLNEKNRRANKQINRDFTVLTSVILVGLDWWWIICGDDGNDKVFGEFNLLAE